ncbi:MAG: hypothetical protein MJZ66_02765 [Bacteroidales bacterium]|nr:hypothetical protein [Bacteroidales bacterium]
MARTIEEIKRQMEERWMQSDALRTLYGWSLDSNGKPPAFDSQYSKVSIENLILYIVAYCAYAIEVLMDHVKEEIEDAISSKEPGRPQWYARMLKEFIYLPALPPDKAHLVTFDPNLGEFVISQSDQGADLTEGEIESARIVKHSVAIDDNRQSLLLLKVAGESEDGTLAPLWDDEQQALLEYIQRIKYAGVKTLLVNKPGDLFSCNVRVWYDPLYGESDIQTECEKAISTYLRALPFNGEYSNMALIDTLQTVRGVRIAELTSAEYQNAGTGDTELIDAKVRPYSGYFKPDNITIQMMQYE